MAGFWIPWECGLTRKREILIIANKLGVSRREAAAICMEFWEWASSQTTDGLLVGVSLSTISDIVGVDGFADSLLSVGWLILDGDVLQLPNWGRFNSQSAKKRLRLSENMRRWRNKQQGG
jgi:hypothetical protein